MIRPFSGSFAAVEVQASRHPGLLGGAVARGVVPLHNDLASLVLPLLLPRLAQNQEPHPTLLRHSAFVAPGRCAVAFDSLPWWCAVRFGQCDRASVLPLGGVPLWVVASVLPFLAGVP